MAEYIFLMHNDARDTGDWGAYLAKLRASGALQGGSSIGGGFAARKNGENAAISDQISGYIKIEAADPNHARALLVGNPVYEAGGTVEIRELPKDSEDAGG